MPQALGSRVACTDYGSLKIEVIETMNATADPSANFKLVIVQTELERFKFLIRSLLRARIAKVIKKAHAYACESWAPSY